MAQLIRFWFEFENSLKPSILNLGCGVTAHGYEDALILMQDQFFHGKTFPLIKKFTENVDISTLDKKHVIPNMGSVVVRGIWFPLK